MSNYTGASRTNYFRVTNEEKYKELFENLISYEDEIYDFSKEEDGIIFHGFGSYGIIDYRIEEEREDINIFLGELQKILPDNEAFMLFEAGHEKLRYVSGYVTVCTSKKIIGDSLENWALQQAKNLLGSNFKTKISY